MDEFVRAGSLSREQAEGYLEGRRMRIARFPHPPTDHVLKLDEVYTRLTELVELHKRSREEANTTQDSPAGQEPIDPDPQHCPGFAVEQILEEVQTRVNKATKEADDKSQGLGGGDMPDTQREEDLPPAAKS